MSPYYSSDRGKWKKMGTLTRNLLTCLVKPLVQVCIYQLSWKKKNIISALTLINALRRVWHPISHNNYVLFRFSQLVRNWGCGDLLYGTGIDYAPHCATIKGSQSLGPTTIWTNDCIDIRCTHHELRSCDLFLLRLECFNGPLHKHRIRHCWYHQGATLPPVLWGYLGSAQASNRICIVANGAWVG